MPDIGHERTDELLNQLERRFASVYRTASKEMQDKITAYFESFAKRDAEMREMIGQTVNGKEWTEQDYKQWRLNQIGRGKRFETLRDQIAERMTKANEVAAAYINDATPGVYSLNRNYTAYTIEQVGGNVGFTLWDESTVKRLIKEAPDLMPFYPPKRAVKRGIDLKWGKKQITSQITQSILQGENLKSMADRLQKAIPTMNRDSAIRAARTAFTGAQNGGRMDSYKTAEDMGVKVRKRWVATKDGRTRHDHRRLDGKTIDWDKTFSNGCRYPGDPKGKPDQTYNCRCTLRTVEKPGIEAEPRQMRVRDPATGKNVLIDEMTYDEWEQWVQSRQFGGIIGTKTVDGIEIKSVSAHSIDRSGERGVSQAAVTDAVTNPLHVQETRTDRNGMRSKRYIGKEATVNVNPDTGNVITVWKTGKRERKRYGGKE